MRGALGDPDATTEQLGKLDAKPTVKLHLAAIRMLVTFLCRRRLSWGADDSISLWAGSHRWDRALVWLFSLAWRALKWLALAPFRLVWWLVRVSSRLLLRLYPHAGNRLE